MDKKERQELIIRVSKEKEYIKISDIIDIAGISRTTLFRDLSELVEKGILEEVGKWKYRDKESITDYLSKPFFDREKKDYNPAMLWDYIPNESSFLNKKQIEILNNAISNLNLDTDFWVNNKRLIETVLIDLSFASSYLEWNTYDYLDTEVLIKYNQIAKDKKQEETQMILNHKKAIEYMIYYKKEIAYDKKLFFEIHTLLADGFLKKDEIWVLRNKKVEIWWSAYQPLENKSQLDKEFDIFIQKLNKIKNPFEQSVFIMIFIPYFQLFADVNKRTSRMICNIPFLKNNLPLISLLSVGKRDYITSLLAIYELNDASMLTQIFVENYIKNIWRYVG